MRSNITRQQLVAIIDQICALVPDVHPQYGNIVGSLHLGSKTNGIQAVLYLYENKAIPLGFTKSEVLTRLDAMLLGAQYAAEPNRKVA